jgi:hypothetical protein
MASSVAIEEEATCPICLNLFNDPRLLPCTHSFDAACLAAQLSNGRITCATCRAAHAVHSVDALPANRALGAIATLLREKAASSAKAAASSGTVHESDLRALLLSSDKSVHDHRNAQDQHKTAYTATLLALLERRVALPAAAKSRILASSWARRDYELPALLFDKHADQFGVADVVKALAMLDCERVRKQARARLDALKRANAAAAKISAAREALENALAREACGTLSGASRKRIKQFIHTIPVAMLEFNLLNFPTKLWKELADTLHLKPSDFQLSWFLSTVFGAEPPVDGGGLIAACMQLTADNVDATLAKFDVPLSFLRTKLGAGCLKAPQRARVAEYTALSQLLWFYSELQCDATDKIIVAKLNAGEDPELGFGKLIDIILSLKADSPLRAALMPVTERVRASLALPLDGKVLVIGDASSSMAVAVKTATIISGFVASLCEADRCNLRFFTSVLVKPPYVPKTLEQILDVASKITASGMTTNAAGLYDVYKAKERYTTIMMVTDEDENGKVDNMNFGELYEKYCAEVCPAKLVFVSFLSATDKGRMYEQLQRGRPAQRTDRVVQLRLDRQRPDLTRLDALLGMLSSESESFAADVEKLKAAAAAPASSSSSS